MTLINTRVHGILDYLVSLIVIASPWIFGFAKGGSETWVPVCLGAMSVVYSLMTNYELGVVRVISMRTHLGLDFTSGLVLALSPWIFGFSNTVYVPHLILGVLEIGAALMTDPATFKKHRAGVSHQQPR